MSSIITDELVAKFRETALWALSGDGDVVMSEENARAALTALIPDIIEACAKRANASGKTAIAHYIRSFAP